MADLSFESIGFAGDAPAPQPSPPPQQDRAKNAFLILGYVFTAVLYFSQGPTVWGIWVARQVGQSKVDMFVVTLASCVVWMMYGLADPPTPPFVILNAVGIVFEISVWRENNIGNMSLLVAVALFLNGVSWTAYGHLADNLYFIVPGYFGIFFGAMQIIVWVLVRFIYHGRGTIWKQHFSVSLRRHSKDKDAPKAIHPRAGHTSWGATSHRLGLNLPLAESVE
ncbi:bidirectional sugar transporter SWEET6b-like [Triticum urartu]|uniref:bidirectional sugar transporter SWEET6b-like n=1 Tax=Triticum urartu TaxID=4572 RepID=UPI0020434ACF|nr:bidirectional sugar transporter SWEET6b-like [Triticum urartu]